jgi:hypothetical protein
LIDEDKINYELVEEVVWRVAAGVLDRFLPPSDAQVDDKDGLAPAW